MKIKALVAALFVAGLTASIGLGATREHGGDGTTTGTNTSTVTKEPRCQVVGLAGAATSGSVAFTVSKTSKNAAKFAGTSVTLSVPAGARVVAVECANADGTLTLRALRVVNKTDHHLDHGPADSHDGGKHK